VIFSGGDKQLRARDIHCHVIDGPADCRKLYVLYFVQLGCGEGYRHTKQTAKTKN
jgi:hypothetical protein